MDYDVILEMLLTELKERGLKEQRRENIDIRNALTEVVALSEKVQKHIAGLDDQAKEDYERYLTLMNSIAESQMNYLYIQGVKDCAYLLKSLGFI